MKPIEQEQDLAVASAAAASGAIADILRFAREGEIFEGMAFDENTVFQLADGLNMALQIEWPRMSAIMEELHPADREQVELVNQLQGALGRFLEAWA